MLFEFICLDCMLIICFGLSIMTSYHTVFFFYLHVIKYLYAWNYIAAFVFYVDGSSQGDPIYQKDNQNIN